MPWPTAPVVTTGMDQDADALPRADILDLTTKFNQLIGMRGVASGVCDLDASGLVPNARLAAKLAALAALSSTAGLVEQTGPNAFTGRTISASIKSFLDAADNAAAKTALGVLPATDVLAGLIELATNAEVSAGTDAVRAITPANLLASLGFTKYFQSAQQTITAGGALTIAHGLGRSPILILPLLICVTAQGGYSVGDIVYINNALNGLITTRGISIVTDATNVTTRMGGDALSLAIHDKSTGTLFAITNANWSLIIRAWG